MEQFIKTMTDSRPYVSSQEAREEADWIQMETAKAWLRRYEASTDQGKLAMCKQAVELMGPEKASRFLPSRKERA